LSLGRLVKQGAKLDWNEQVAELALPNGERRKADVINNCPYVNLDTVSAIKDWKRDLEKTKREAKSFSGTI